PVDGDERFADIAQGRLAGRSEMLLGDHDPHRPSIVHPAQAVKSESIVAHAPFRFLGNLDLSDEVTDGRVPAGEIDAGFLADQAAASVASDEIVCPQMSSVGQRDVDTAVVLHETCDLMPAINPDRQFIDPAGKDTLDVVLP